MVSLPPTAKALVQIHVDLFPLTPLFLRYIFFDMSVLELLGKTRIYFITTGQ